MLPTVGPLPSTQPNYPPPPTAAYWYSPRTGHYYDPQDQREHPTPRNVLATRGADYSFDPPGEPTRDNDWVLLLSARAR